MDFINKVLQGDCLEVLKDIPDNSIDSLVTDPPYGLSQHKPEEVVNCLMAWCKGEVYQPKGTGFMSKSWDSWTPGPEVWREVYRVLKPGAHALIFAGTRSVDLMGMSVRLAGFELRDMIVWSHGQGFPKNLDVSKAIDKAGNKNEVFDEVRNWLRTKVKAAGLTYKQIDSALGNPNSHLASHYLDNSQPMIPTPERWAIIKVLLGVDEDIDRPPRIIEYEREIIGYQAVQKGVAFSSDGLSEVPITIPATPESKQWDGWGTALKPAIEPILLCRKPLDGTVANNVLTHGVGGINIEACRIGTGEDRASGGGVGLERSKENVYELGIGTRLERPTGGRYPANLVLSCGANCDGANHSPDCPVTVIGDQSGVTVSSGGTGTASKNWKSSGYTISGSCQATGGLGDKGTAARYFKQLPFDSETTTSIYYQAKASKSDRNKGLSEMLTLRSDLTPEEIEYVVSELTSHGVNL